MDEILGYDCDGEPIYEFQVLVGIWVNDVPVEELEKTDPRMYCAVVADDGASYAISVNDSWNEKAIREREHIPDGKKIPTIIKPISEMVNYEIVYVNGSYGCFVYEYEYDCHKLKRKLNKLLNESKGRVLKNIRKK